MRSEFAKLLATPVRDAFWFHDYRFVLGASGDLRRRGFALRQQVYLEEEYIAASSRTEMLFTDEFDDVSEHLVVLDKDDCVVGATRFVLPSPLGYPTERFFNVQRPNVRPERLGEFSRLTIAAGHRGGARAPMIGLLKLVYEVMVRNSVDHVYAFMAPRLITSLASLGCVTRRLPELPPTPEHLANRRPMKGYFEKQDILPVLLRLDEAIAAITAS